MIVELRPSEGGTEAMAFALELRDALQRRAERLGCTTQIEDGEARTLRLSVTGKRSEEIQRLTGTHRVQRVSANDKHGRRHTSSVIVTTLKEGGAQEVTLRDEDLHIDRYRGSGKGGQHRNKVSTAIRARHLPSGIVVTMERGRSQHQNLQWAKEEILQRLTQQNETTHAQEVNKSRLSQVNTWEAKTFTHNEQRDEVVDHQSGKRWTTRAFKRGQE